MHSDRAMRRARVLALAGGAALLAILPRVYATPYYWDGDGSGTVGGGSGTWSTSVANWATTPTDNAYQVWPNGNEAFFGNTAGVVAVAGPVTVNSLTFTTSGYVINGSLLTIGNLGTISTGSTTAIVNAGIAHTLGTTTTKIGSGMLILNGSNTFQSTFTIAAGTLLFGNDVNFFAATVNPRLSASAGAVIDFNNQSKQFGSLVGIAGSTLSLGSGVLTEGSTTNTSFAGTMTGTGSLKFVATGALAKLQMNGQNTYSGGTTMQATNATSNLVAGVDSVGNPGSITSGAFGTGALTLISGELSSSTTAARTILNPVILAGSFTIGDATNSGAMNFLGQATLTANATLNNSFASVSYAGNISEDATGGRSLTKVGSNLLVLSGNNTYTGGTIISDGTIQVGSGGTSGTLGTGTVQADSNLVFNRSDAFVVNNAITGNGRIYQAGPGTTTLAGSNSYSGNTNVVAGTLALASTGVINSSSNLALGGGTLAIASRTSSQVFSNTSVNSGQSAIAAASMGAGNSLQLNSINRNIGGTLDFTLPTSGSINTTASNSNPAGGQQTILGGYATVNGNTWAVSGVADQSGDISGLTNYSPTFVASQDIDSPAGASTPGSITVNSLRFNHAAASTVSGAADTLTIATGGILETSAVGANSVTFNQGSLTSNSQDLAVIQNNAASGMTINSIISGGIALTKSGPGLLTLGGNNAYTNGTVINAGILGIGADTAVNNFNGNGTFNGGALQLNNYSSALSFSSVANLKLGAAGGAASTITGTITGTTGLAFVGPGTLIVSGTKSYTGSTVISGGILQIAAASALASGTVNVANGAALTISSGGSIAATTNLVLNGTYTEGNATRTIATLNGTGAVNLGSTTALTISGGGVYSGTIAGTGGKLTISGGQLTLTGSNSYTGITTFTGGTLAINSDQAVNNLAGGSAFTSGALQFNNYTTALTFNNLANLKLGAAAGAASTVPGGAITGTSALNSVGPGTLTLGGSNSYSGITTLTAGVLNFSALNNLGSNSSVNFAGGALQYASGNVADLSVRTVSLSGAGGTIDTNGNTVSFANPIGNNGTGGVSKAGPGTLILNGSNTYIGSTEVASGTLELGATGAIVGTLLRVDGGATFTADSGGAIAPFSYVTDNGTYNEMNAARTIANLNGNGTFNLLSSTVLTISNGGSFSGLIADNGTAGKLNVTGGTLNLTGTNTFTGGTTLAAGTLVINSDAAVNNFTGGLTATGGTLQLLNYPSNLNFNNVGVLNLGAATGVASTLNGAITGSTSLNYVGPGTLILARSNSYTGSTSIAGGTLNFSSLNNLGAGSSITFAGGALQYAAGNTADISTRTITLSSTGTIDTNGNDVTFANPIGNSGTGGLAKTGTGKLTLLANNTYGGNTTLAGGVLNFAGINSLGTGGTIGFVGGTLQYATGNTADISARTVTIGAGGATIDTNGNNVTFANSIGSGGNVGLTKAGAGVLTFTVGNNYNGATTFNGGAVNFNDLNNFGGGSSLIFTGGTLQYASGNTSDISNRTVTIAAGGGSIDTNGNDVTLNNSIGNGGSGALTKVGNGALMLNGGNNNYTGGTNITGGTLVTNSNFSNGTFTASGGVARVASRGNNNDSGGVTIVPAVSFTGGTLDLTNNAMLVDAPAGGSQIGPIRAALHSGFANGAWTGTGLTSSTAAGVAADPLAVAKTALAYGEASALGITNFAGHDVATGNAVVIKYALSGDANIDGQVNTNDFTALALNYNQTGQVWTAGDFNYDGTINALDFNAIATNYGQSLGAPALAPGLGTLVPEPTSIGVLAMGMLLPRRRRK